MIGMPCAKIELLKVYRARYNQIRYVKGTTPLLWFCLEFNYILRLFARVRRAHIRIGKIFREGGGFPQKVLRQHRRLRNNAI